MDSEEIQQEQQLPLGDGRPETSKSGAVAVSSPAVDPTSPLNVDLALALLERRDLPPETLEQLGRVISKAVTRNKNVAFVRSSRFR